jgi:hypothetical protein
MKLAYVFCLLSVFAITTQMQENLGVYRADFNQLLAEVKYLANKI